MRCAWDSRWGRKAQWGTGWEERWPAGRVGQWALRHDRGFCAGAAGEHRPGDQGRWSGRPPHWLTSAPWARTTPGSHGAQAPPVSRHVLSSGHLTAAASLLQVLSEPWRLSTSQSAQFQIRMFDPNKYPNHLGPGGGFGPVSALEGGWVGRTGPGFQWRAQGLRSSDQK